MPKSQALPEERPAESIGNRFRNARINQGKSLQEAARVTCINTTTLANLESDNFAQMPAEVFTKGFIKLYAQYLALDPTEALELYAQQERLKPERQAESSYRRELLTGASMASPFSLFRSNPKIRIIAILLTVLLAFYALGAIFKVGQKRPDQTAPEDELAKSLVDANTQPLPGPPGEQPAPTETTTPGDVAGNATTNATQPEALPGAAAEAGTPGIGTPAAGSQPLLTGGGQSPLPVVGKTAPAPTPAPAAPPEATDTGRAGVTVVGR
jgi:cytoskeleton protein RodZ